LPLAKILLSIGVVSPFLPLSAWISRAATREISGLVVSGGNTLLVEIDEARQLRVLSTTRDDAAGEALDKGAKLLGLGYPGGPQVEKLARTGDTAAYDFPRGLGRRDNLEFSFSGLKTSLRYQLEKMTVAEIGQCLPDLCASYQQAVIDALLRKLKAALRAGPRGKSPTRAPTYASVGLSGGVANNRALRTAVSEAAQASGQGAGIPVLLAESQHTGDNAGMIGFAAWADTHGVNRRDGLSLEICPGSAL